MAGSGPPIYGSDTPVARGVPTIFDRLLGDDPQATTASAPHVDASRRPRPLSSTARLADRERLLPAGPLRRPRVRGHGVGRALIEASTPRPTRGCPQVLADAGFNTGPPALRPDRGRDALHQVPEVLSARVPALLAVLALSACAATGPDTPQRRAPAEVALPPMKTFGPRALAPIRSNLASRATSSTSPSSWKSAARFPSSPASNPP